MPAPELLLQGLGISRPEQIELDVIAWTRGLEIEFRHMNGCDARIVGRGDRGVLTVNSRQTPERQRFSVAHELGHWELHRGALMLCRDDDIDIPRAQARAHERDADAFAAALLMPAYLFVPAFEESTSRDPWRTVMRLSEVFRTSLLATAFRTVNLGLWDGWLVCHSATGRNWFRAAPSRLQDAFPRRDLDPRTPAFDAVYAKRAPRAVLELPADTWFEHAHRRRIIEATRIYGDSALSFIRFLA